MREQVGDAYTMDASYDAAGNFIALARKGLLRYGIGDAEDEFGQLDKLSYTYEAGQLVKIAEEGAIGRGFYGADVSWVSELSYDGAGNVTSVGAVQMDYNVLNLPQRISKDLNPLSTNPLEEQRIELENKYSYDGDKYYTLISRTEGEETTITERLTLDGLVLEGDQQTGLYIPKQYAHESGRMVWEDGVTKMEYVIRDHLGNTRVVYRDDNLDGQISTQPADEGGVYDVRRRYDYYPFGLEIEGRWAPDHDRTVDNRYRYNGKEISDDAGIYYYGARVYDPSWGRFTGVDPLAEKMPSWSPYSYTFNNPILYTDPDGPNPIKGFKALINVGRRAYKTYKRTGKLTPKSFKKAGLDEIVDIADDLFTLFGSDASFLERLGAGVDLVVGTDFNNKKTKASSKGRNKLKPDGDAKGDHTTFKRDDNGDIYKYETYEKTSTGHDNPVKRFDGGKPDGSPGQPHTNKQTKKDVPTPHVQGKKIPGGVRPAKPTEIPKNKRFNNGG